MKPEQNSVRRDEEGQTETEGPGRETKYGYGAAPVEQDT
jgi:hypothetical protein